VLAVTVIDADQLMAGRPAPRVNVVVQRDVGIGEQFQCFAVSQSGQPIGRLVHHVRRDLLTPQVR